jgi:hypothetical protein
MLFVTFFCVITSNFVLFCFVFVFLIIIIKKTRQKQHNIQSINQSINHYRTMADVMTGRVDTAPLTAANIAQRDSATESIAASDTPMLTTSRVWPSLADDDDDVVALRVVAVVVSLW